MAGKVGWIDLTVENAEEVRDFYQQVTGWKSTSVEMGSYDDYCMIPSDSDDAVAGICHRQGVNSSIPGGWMIYITVDDVESSKNKCLELGGKIVVETRDMGAGGKICVIEDPSGATAALFEEA